MSKLGEAVRTQFAEADEQGQLRLITNLLQTVSECEAKSGLSAEEAAIRTGMVSGVGSSGGRPTLAEAGKQLYELGVSKGWVRPISVDEAVFRPPSPEACPDASSSSGHHRSEPPSSEHTKAVAHGIAVSTYHLLSNASATKQQEIAEAILAASSSGSGPSGGEPDTGAASARAAVLSLDTDVHMSSKHNKMVPGSAPTGAPEAGETGGTCTPSSTHASTPPKLRRKRRQSQQLATELAQAADSCSQRVHDTRIQMDLDKMD